MVQKNDKNPYDVDIAKNLRDLLHRIGWTQDRLAQEIHSSRQTINRWMTGKVTPGQNNLARIAKAAGCKLEWLSLGFGEMFAGDFVSADLGNNEARLEMERALGQTIKFLEQGTKQKISNLLIMSQVVLESGHYGAVLSSVITAFYRAVKLEEKLGADQAAKLDEGLDLGYMDSILKKKES